MAETAAKITILGLDLVGTSIGLSLRQEAGNYQVMGHDREPSRMNQAKKQGGVDSSSWNLHRACDGASLVIITEPLSQLPETLEHIHEDIAEDAVIFSIGPVMQPALNIAADNLPNHINFVAGRPVHNDFGSPPEPRSDLLKESTFCIGAAPGTKSTALELVSNLLARLGAKPLYIDSLEHDGIVAAVEQLPELLAAALFQTAYDAPGWHESQKLAGRRFALSTGMEATPAEMAATLFTNRDMLLQRLDQLSTLLETWRTHLSAEDAKPLEEQLDGLIEGRAKWERDAKLRDWDRTMEPTSRGEVGGLGQMLSAATCTIGRSNAIQGARRRTRPVDSLAGPRAYPLSHIDAASVTLTPGALPAEIRSPPGAGGATRITQSLAPEISHAAIR